jgi:hypothetical protein
MRIYTREDGDSNWAPVAIIMTVLVVVMAMGYFFWYAPSQSVVVAPTREVIVNNPTTPAPSAPNTVVFPSSPGQTGATGATGARGQSGTDGAPGAAGAEGAPGRTGDPGKSDDKGSGGQ